MKKLTLLFLLAGLTGWFTVRHFSLVRVSDPQRTGILPGGPNEENREMREAWERKRYADPVTGRIPEGIRFKERWFAAGIPRAVSERSGNTWTARGPWNYGGRTRALAIDATNENHLLAGGVTGGLWSSDDAGQSWTRRTTPDAHPGCVSIAQDIRPGKTDTWYYLSGEISGASAFAPGAFYFGDGLFKSTDGGQTWSLLPSTSGGNPQSFTTAFQTGWRIVTDPVDTLDVVYMACYAAIFKSTNGGASWSVARGTSNLNAGSYYTDVAISPTGVVYATLSSEGVQKGIWRSADGKTWTDITPANFPATYDRIVIGINPNDEKEVYFLGATPGAGHFNEYLGSNDWSSLWKYTYLGGDGAGANGQWEDRSPNLPNVGTEFDRFAIQGGYDIVMKIQPGTNHVFVGGTSLWRSTDGFATPNNTAHIAGYKPGTTLPFFELYPNHHPDLHTMLFLPSNPDVALTGSDGGLHRTENCNAGTVVWSSLNRGYHTTQFYTIMIEHSTPGDNTILGGLQDNGNLFVNSDDPKKPWVQTINGDGAYGAIADGKGFYIVSARSGGEVVVKCAIDGNGAVTAFQRFDPIGPNPDDYLFINPLAIDPTGQNVLYLPADNRLYRHGDLSAVPLNNEWQSTAQGWTATADTTVGTIGAIAVSHNNPAHRVYLGTDARRVYRIDNADTGTPVLTATKDIGVATTSNVSCIAVDPDNADRVIVCYSNYGIYSIWLSENGGQNWKKVAGNLEANFAGGGSGPSIRWLSILPFPDGSRKYFCATSTGLYSADSLIEHTSTNPGTKWTLESPDLIGNAVVDFVDVRPVDGLVVAATHGIGVYSANFMPAIGSTEPGRTAEVRVSPNPAGAFVDFQATGVPDGAVHLRMFDLKGRLVRQANWSGPSRRVEVGDLTAGVYVYELQGAGWRKSGRLIKG